MSDTATTVLTTIEAPADAGGDTPALETQAGESAQLAETPKPSEPDPRLEISKKLHLAASRESKARQLQHSLAEKSRQVEAKERAAEERAAKLAQEQAEWEEDPVAFMLKKGKDPVEAVRRFAKPQSEEEKRIAKLEQRIADDEKQAEERKKAWEARNSEQQKQQHLQRFVSGITPDEFPYLTTMHPANEVPALVDSMLNERAGTDHEGNPITLLQAFRAEHGRNPTNREIADALEHRSETRARSLYEGLASKLAPSTQVVEAPPATSGPPSLSNAHAGRMTPKAAPQTLSREERIAKSRKELRERTDAEAAELTEP